MTEETILVKEEHSICMITLNRDEKSNAFDDVMAKRLIHVLKEAKQDKAVKVILIHAKGKHFCAGADLGRMKQMADASYQENFDDAELIADLMYELYTMPQPTIVLAHGATLGGGLGLLATCDIAIASTDAVFGFSEVKVGITPSTISPYVLAAIGERAAHYYFLTGNRFGTDEAHRIGLVHQVVEPEKLFQTGHAMAETLLLNSSSAMREAKQLIRYIASHHQISEDLGQKTAEHLAKMRTSEDAREGLEAFLEKRSPVWSE